MFTTILTLNNLITNKPKSIYQDLGLFVFVQHGLYGILTKKTSKPVINYSAIYERFIPQISDTCHTDCQPSQYQANGRYNKAQHHQHEHQFYHTAKAITNPLRQQTEHGIYCCPQPAQHAQYHKQHDACYYHQYKC